MRLFEGLALALLFCACRPQPPQPCQPVEATMDGGVRWFELAVGSSTGAIDLENLEARDGFLYPLSPGGVAFTVDDECQRRRWIGFATDAPFELLPGALSFPVTRPAQRAALPLIVSNQTDSSIAVEFHAPEPFGTESVLPLDARTSREFFVSFAPTLAGEFDGELIATAFTQATRTVSLHGVGGGPVIGVDSRFDAGVVAALGPQQRPDGRWVRLSNDAPAGEDFHSDLLLPANGSSDCPGVEVSVENPGLLQAGASTRILLQLPTNPVGASDCAVTIASVPKPVSFRAFWTTQNVPCDINWPSGPVASDGGVATVELVTGIEGCRLTYPRLEPADAGSVLTGWNDLDVPPHTVVPVDVFVHEPAVLRVNVSDPAIRTIGVSVIP